MNTDYIRQIIRGLIIFLAQVIIFKRIGLGSGWLWENGNIFIYPIIILLLPISMTRHYVILLGFVVGLLVDLFYDTVGIHAFALTALAYFRGPLLMALEPRGGYQLLMQPTKSSMGTEWLLTYTSIALFIHALTYSTIEVFTFVFFGKILLKTIVTWVLSMIVIVGYHFLFNPRK